MIVILHRDQRHLFARYPADHLPAGRFIGIEHREVEIHEQASLLRFFVAPAELFFYLGELCNIHCGVKRSERFGFVRVGELFHSQCQDTIIQARGNSYPAQMKRCRCARAGIFDVDNGYPQ